MSAELVIFAIVATVAIVSAIAVVVSKNPVHAVLYLVINFFSIAMLYLVLSAQFVAFLQILVYAGAIMVLFLFVVMLLNMTGAIEATKDKLRYQKGIALALAALAILEVWLVVSGNRFPETGATVLPADFGHSGPVGAKLYFGYLLPFEVTSVLLLIAMVGSVVLARRRD